MNRNEKAAHIREKRESKSIDLEMISNHLGIPVELYQKYENGLISVSTEHLTRILKYLDIDFELFDLALEKERKPVEAINSLFKYDAIVQKNDFPTFKVLIDSLKVGFSRKQNINTPYVVESLLFHKDTLNDYKPYLFVKVCLALVFIAVLTLLSNDLILANLTLSLIAPMTLLVLLYEVDKSCDIKGYKLLIYFLVGGTLSIAITFFFRDFVGYPEIIFLEDVLTGLVEESAKIIVVVMIMLRLRIKNVFQGILIGFAVGAGFDAFETSSYGLLSLLDPELPIEDMHISIIYRGLFAFLGIGHHYWTAILAGTFVAVNKFDKIKINNIFSLPFMIVFMLIVLIHALWNFSSSYFSYILMPLVIVLSLFIFIRFIKVQYANDYLKEQKHLSNP